jgi:hypothetical protein
MQSTKSIFIPQDPSEVNSEIPWDRLGLFTIQLKTFLALRFIDELKGSTYMERIYSGPRTLHNVGAIAIHARGWEEAEERRDRSAQTGLFEVA